MASLFWVLKCYGIKIMIECLFCKIINKEVNATIIEENDYAIAFKDINPIAPYHILIIPKEHISSTSSINQKNSFLIGEMALMANKITSRFIKGNNGSRWIFNNGENGGQTVFHMHMHLIAGRKFSWPPG